MRIRDYHIKIGTLSPGRHNTISDVAGVQIGHSTIRQDDIQTGVTAVIPHSGNLFEEKVVGAIHTINGFGKTTGSIQLEELGTIETPIILTNTFAVGTGIQGVIDYTLQHNPHIGRTTGTLNSIVCECNDMLINDIRKESISKNHVLEAIESAKEDFPLGSIGAGTGMISFGLKGGIGSSSRVVPIHNETYTIGVLVLSNFGRLEHLTIDGQLVGPSIKERLNENRLIEEREQGSIIIVVATDAPLSDRQVKRVLKRTTIGLGKTGSHIGNGSGDIAIGFTTANKVKHEDSTKVTFPIQVIQDYLLDSLFQAASEATEEAIIDSMLMSTTTTARNGQKVYSLREFMNTLL
ncbi:P1 family peptidase [Bacillus sp. BGMRC 2118]|nr:P1 family peptidase [Bacillus sp. BGMRC 2118]